MSVLEREILLPGRSSGSIERLPNIPEAASNAFIVFIKISKNAKNHDFQANLSCIASDNLRTLL
ncbi:MAG: hypothetical protein BA861_01610 [Desulfobacterales bacterium S3730MH5]|nr:MAG: hypothetical protein BA861_01610 [Desulfobacterales bacterium S3730MH5]